MSEDFTPVLQVETGTDGVGFGPTPQSDSTTRKPQFHYFQLGWRVLDWPPLPGTTERRHIKALIHRTRYPGSGDTLDRELRLYDADGAVFERLEEVESYGRGPRVKDFADKFEANAAAIESGTPIGVLNLDPAKVSSLKDKGIVTVEALRDVPDVHLPSIGHGARALRDRATDYLSGRDQNAALSSMQSENDGLRERLQAAEDEAAETKREIIAMRQEMATFQKAKGR